MMKPLTNEPVTLNLNSLTPRQIVEELNRYVIGQKDAKRMVAIALRNRWRRQQLAPKRLDLNAAVSALESLLRRTLSASIELDIQLNDTPIWVNADPVGLDQVIMNLALNARDAVVNQGGIISIKVSSIGNPGQSNYLAKLEVADNGTGIPQEAIAHIFEPFFTTKGPGQGTGLGLATVQGIVHQHSGTITACSEVGKGARFEVILPAISATGIEAPAKLDAAVISRIRNVRVLVVEDEESVRRMIVTNLRKHSIIAVEATDASNALEFLSREEEALPHLVISDIMMPGMNGIELARIIMTRWPAVRLLLVSGYSPEGLGPDDVTIRFLAKPFTSQQLIEAVAKSLGPLLPSELSADASIWTVMTGGMGESSPGS